MHRTSGIRADLWNEDGGDLGLTDHDQLAVLGACRDEVLLPALQGVVVVVLGCNSIDILGKLPNPTLILFGVLGYV